MKKSNRDKLANKPCGFLDISAGVDTLRVGPGGVEDFLAVAEMALSRPAAGGLAVVLGHHEPERWEVAVLVGVPNNHRRSFEGNWNQTQTTVTQVRQAR